MNIYTFQISNIHLGTIQGTFTCEADSLDKAEIVVEQILDNRYYEFSLLTTTPGR